ncbi:hypothetical protein KDA23_01855 [Candidatus Saccharibacteria bacterium]|nr:hypothetical protein [Candidatus Saccharibacteria bacterium]
MRKLLKRTGPEQSVGTPRERALHCAQLILDGNVDDAILSEPHHHDLDWFRGANMVQAILMDPTFNRFLGLDLNVPATCAEDNTANQADMISDSYTAVRGR